MSNKPNLEQLLAETGVAVIGKNHRYGSVVIQYRRHNQIRGAVMVEIAPVRQTRISAADLKRSGFKFPVADVSPKVAKSRKINIKASVIIVIYGVHHGRRLAFDIRAGFHETTLAVVGVNQAKRRQTGNRRLARQHKIQFAIIVEIAPRGGRRVQLRQRNIRLQEQPASNIVIQVGES